MDTLPDELICLIACSLPLQDKTRLIRVSKRFDKLIIPSIWRKIEFHEQGHHLASDINYPDSVLLENDRPYLHGRYWSSYPPCFLEILNEAKKEGTGRFELLVSRLQNLCCNVPIPAHWDLYTSFVNLEMLALERDNHNEDDFSSFSGSSASPLSKLRFVSLFGYIPKNFAAWILSAVSTLERVELGLLDRPISGTIAYERTNYPLSAEKLQLSDGESESSDLDSDYGSLDGEAVCPRPSSGFMPNTDGSQEVTFPSLKHLYLSQPSQSDYEDSVREYSWSNRAETACLADWKKLLSAASSTLEVLVLEQRPCAEDIEQDSYSVTEFVLNDKSGVGSERLIKMVLKCLNTEHAFPNLKKVYLWGIAVGMEDGGPISRVERERTPGSKLMWFLQDRGIACEARVGRWTLFEEGNGEVSPFYHRPIKSDDGSGRGYRRLIATTDPDTTDVDTRKPPPATEDDDSE